MKEFTLPSGKKATLRKGKGRDLLNAQRKTQNTDEIPYALLSELATIDGESVLFEDILDMDFYDVSMLLTEFNSAGEQSTTQNQS